MTDRELLELAAKAAEYKIYWYVNDVHKHGRLLLIDESVKRHDWKSWNPLVNDGDALRLAVQLEMRVDTSMEMSAAYTQNHGCVIQHSEFTEGDPYAATRRAIVRAAAEIGKAMTQGDKHACKMD